MQYNILVISNGKGEDSIAVTILDKLRQVCQEEDISWDDVRLTALPLLGNGAAYRNNAYYTAASWQTLPSHGFSSIINLWRDIRGGLLENLRRQKEIILRASQEADLIVTVGDIMPVFLAAFYGNNKKIIHVATAISAYLRKYSLPELWLFRKYVSCVVCRDEYTCSVLQKSGVKAFYAGNPMMDDPILQLSDVNLGLDKKRKKIVLVPSSRDDAYSNTQRLLELVRRFPKRTSYLFVLSLAPNLSLEKLRKALENTDWILNNQRDGKKPIVAELTHPEAPTVQVVQGYFAECLESAVMVWGMTGTGNEQIAGLGIPLVLLRGRSAAASAKRLKHYQKLLGAAVFVPRGFERRKAESVQQLLINPKQLQYMGEVGQSRMGKPGGAYAIARKIWYLLNA